MFLPLLLAFNAHTSLTGAPVACQSQSIEAGLTTFTIMGGVKAAFYWKGRSTVGDWLAARNSPAPWAEIGSDK